MGLPPEDERLDEGEEWPGLCWFGGEEMGFVASKKRPTRRALETREERVASALS